MTAVDPTDRLPALTEVEEQLLPGWPETKIEQSLNRIARPREVLGAERVHAARNVATAIEAARSLTALPDTGPDAVVLVTGSVVTVGDADLVLPTPPKPRGSR